MPKRAIAFIGGVLAFLGVVVAIASWAAFSGDAGSQRGLVIHTEIPQDVVVAFEDGQRATLGSARNEATFVVRREDFPGTVTVSDASGELLLERRFEYSEFAEADFRLSVDRNGFYPTTELRDTPDPEGSPAGEETDR